MEPRCFEVQLKTFAKQLAGQDNQPLGSVRWICLPYFSLQRYSGLLSGSTPSAFPPQTLLQAQYSRTTEQRDMLQAVCQLGGARKDECFHVAQIWCLVVDNCTLDPFIDVVPITDQRIALLVTCGTMSELDLRGDSVDLKSQPSPEAAGSRPGRILVKHGNAVTWSLPAVACSTWFVSLC